MTTTPPRDGIPMSEVVLTQAEVYDEDDPVRGDEVEVPFFDDANKLRKWAKNVNKPRSSDSKD